jgi:4-hydroxy-3-methylbut-2-enyl diphosphate reductase
MGVRRAVDLAQGEMEKAGSNPVFSMGPLIHNPRVLNDFEKRGLAILDEGDLPASLSGAAVIIRAHGISPQLETELKHRGARIIDATCPKVKASQLKAKKLIQSGYRLFLAGESGHGEIIGIQGWAAEACSLDRSAGPSCIIAGSAAEAERAAEALCREEPEAKIALIGQTTISAEEYRAIGEGIKKYFPGLEIIETICGATKDRQEALRELLDQAGAIIVAGGKESSNTRRLLAIAEASGKPCVLAESADDIPAEFLDVKTIGLCAGASTPDEVIDEIERGLAGL